MTAEALILHFLTYVRVARVEYLVRFLDCAWQIPAGTTKNTISRMVQRGAVVRVGYGKYSLGAGAE